MSLEDELAKQKPKPSGKDFNKADYAPVDSTEVGRLNKAPDSPNDLLRSRDSHARDPLSRQWTKKSSR